MKPIRIGNCSGFFGDRLSAAAEMVRGGQIDVLTGDWLAELTMVILAKQRMKHPESGYARTFLHQMEEVLGECVERGIKVVSNAGGLNPEGCAQALNAIAKTNGISAKIAWISGDDLTGRAVELIGSGALVPFDDRVDLGDGSALLTAHADLGCRGAS